MEEKICKIVNDTFYYALEVDGEDISFVGGWNVDYFQKHYEELGYKVIKEDRYTENQ